MNFDDSRTDEIIKVGWIVEDAERGGNPEGSVPTELVVTCSSVGEPTSSKA